MLLARHSSNVRALFASPNKGAIARLQLPFQLRQRHIFAPNELVANTPTAKNLHGIGVWASDRRTGKEKKPQPKVKGDERRVNLVDERLCDDIFGYYGDSLRERHQGCDIVDFYPGAGVWSKKLNDLLKPRSHILLEPDEDLYKPFLAPLLEKPNTTLIPKSGITWEDLHEILSPKYLPHQVEQPRDQAPTRNDTLLITANFSWFPKRKFKSWASVTQLLLFQFVDAIRSSNLGQKYGLVRMLVWTLDDEKTHLLPRCVQLRRRLAVEGELACEWVVEVAGSENTNTKFPRDEYIDLESTQNTIDKMRANGIVTPAGRESPGLAKALALEHKVVAGNQPPKVTASNSAEFEDLREQLEKGLILPMSPKRRRLTLLANYHTTDENFRVIIMEILAEKAAVSKLFEEAKSPADLAAAQKRAAEWNKRIASEKNALVNALRPCHDNLHIFRQSPPVLHWDRRPVEPLLVKAEEFFPNVPCSLLDIQPKAAHPHIRRTNNNSKTADVFELIVRQLIGYSASPSGDVLEKLHPGARQDIIPECPSLTDPKMGGSPMGGQWGDINGRCLNQKQLEELITAWAKSPFAPDFKDLLRYTHDLDDNDGDYSSTVGNVAGKMSIRNLA